MRLGVRKPMRKESVVYTGKSRIWAGSIIAALVAAVAVFAVMMQMEKNMLTRYEKGTILVATCGIPKGQVMGQDNYKNYLEMKEMDVNLIPETAVTSTEEISRLIPCYDIEAGTLLTKGMFEELNEVTEKMQEPVIAGFKVEDMYQVVGGVLRAGDRIHIFSVREVETEMPTENGEMTEYDTKLIWSDVFVQEVFDQAGTAIACEDDITAAQRINVYFDKADIATFYSELSNGSLRAVKVCD